MDEFVFINFSFSASGNNQKDAAYMNIKSISPSRISLKNLIVITQVGWNAINIHNSKDCLLTLHFLFSHFGNNHAAFMDINRASGPHHRHGSSDCGEIYKFNSDHLFLLLVSMFLLVYSLAVTPLFPPC